MKRKCKHLEEEYEAQLEMQRADLGFQGSYPIIVIEKRCLNCKKILDTVEVIELDYEVAEMLYNKGIDEKTQRKKEMQRRKIEARKSEE